MADYTRNKKLELPKSNEKYDVTVTNKNNMIIDSELHKLDLKNNSQDNLLATKESLNSEITRAIAAEKRINNSLQDYIDSAFIQSNYYTDIKIAELINGAPTTLDTLKEIADAMIEAENVVKALEEAIGTKANEPEFQAHAENKTVHITASEKEKIKEIDTIKQSFQNGCSIISGTLTSLGIATAENASPEIIAANIQKMYDTRYTAGANASKTGTATADKVLQGYTFTSADGIGIVGTIPIRNEVSVGINCGQGYTIPEGYHNGKGTVTANSLASQTQATATAANITKGKTAYINGIKVTGTGADNTANYNNGYNAGVVAADARINTASANYKGGYNAGYGAGSGSRGHVYKAFLNYTGNWNSTWTINVGFTACMVIMCTQYVAGSSYQTYAVYTPTENFIAINNQGDDKGTKAPWIPTFSGNNIILPVPEKSMRATTPVFILAMDQIAFNL